MTTPHLSLLPSHTHARKRTFIHMFFRVRHPLPSHTHARKRTSGPPGCHRNPNPSISHSRAKTNLNDPRMVRKIDLFHLTLTRENEPVFFVSANFMAAFHLTLTRENERGRGDPQKRHAASISHSRAKTNGAQSAKTLPARPSISHSRAKTNIQTRSRRHLPHLPSHTHARKRTPLPGTAAPGLHFHLTLTRENELFAPCRVGTCDSSISHSRAKTNNR